MCCKIVKNILLKYLSWLCVKMVIYVIYWVKYNNLQLISPPFDFFSCATKNLKIAYVSHITLLWGSAELNKNCRRSSQNEREGADYVGHWTDTGFCFIKWRAHGETGHRSEWLDLNFAKIILLTKWRTGTETRTVRRVQ